MLLHFDPATPLKALFHSVSQRCVRLTKSVRSYDPNVGTTGAADWVPDWYPTVSSASDPVPPSQPAPNREENVEQFNIRPAKTLYVSPSANRMVRRKLKGIHIFMITVNGTLGTGLYWRGGQILELAGPLAAPLSFLLVGLLSWAVMQCITEMLCIWPIPGALSVYITEFVDAEPGIAVGVAYWFTYSVAFGALTATLAAEVNFWTGSDGSKTIDGLVVYTAIPLTLVLINTAGIEIYGPLEVVFGVIKVSCLAVVIVFLGAINGGAGNQGYLGTQYWSSIAEFDKDAASNWAIAFLTCLSIATFAYTGVEIVAASALESAPPTRRTRRGGVNRTESDLPRQASDAQIGRTVKWSSMYILLLATAAYTLSGLLISLDIPWNHYRLPRLSWIQRTMDDHCASSTATPAETSSAFVEIAAESGIPQLANVFNGFLVFTCLTCAGTNLYVASRTLFGLTSRLDGGKGQSWFLRILAWFGRTDSRRVPFRAMIFSAAGFIWVPFLQLRSGTSTTTSVGMFIEILAQMGSVAVVIVWTCEVLAFIRYYKCIKQHQTVLEAHGIPQVRRSGKGDHNVYPYRSPLQPVLAYVALAGCLFILIVANGAFLWGGFYRFPFLSSYLFVLAFIGIWILLKVVRGGRWRLLDLSNPDKVVRKFRNLHDIRLAAT
ncbi:amino acid permease-domain-containing protein [Aspergillus undulatus]|uniref:amino acid permease-domain-containing protein n=1 Tax=Aspergillus undulatus TaxID=1810928 RepID=UPI003CCDA408